MAKLDELLAPFKLGFPIPGAVEKYIGNSSEPDAVAQSGGLFDDARANGYVNAVGQKLVALSERPGYGFQFGIVTDPNPNAFALPNGHIYITLGLLRLLRNEAQLANVLGHEVGHVTKSHSVNQIAFNMGAIGVAGLVTRMANQLAGGGAISKDDRETGKGLMAGVLANGYSRENEREADDVGQNLASKAGWDPSGMMDVMAVFKSLEKEKPQGIERLMTTHPLPGERITAAVERAQKLPAGEIAADRYAQFLMSIGVSHEEIAQSGLTAAFSWMGNPGAALVFGASSPWMKVAAIGTLVLGGGVIVWAVLSKKK